MENSVSLVREIGQIAGIGGLALGTLALIFREVIRKNVFPSLTKTHAFQILRLIIVLTFSVAALGIGAWVFAPLKTVHTETIKRIDADIEPELTAHLGLVDSSKYADVYESMSKGAKARIPRQLVIRSFEQVRSPLGVPIDRQISGVVPHDRAPDGTVGPFVTVGLITRFDAGTFAEFVSFQAEANVWKVAGHTIVPCSPPVCNPK